MTLALACLALACLAFVASLTVDGLRAVGTRRRRQRQEEPLALVVAARQEVAGELLCLTLRHPAGKPLPPFAAGQHVLVHAPAGPGGGAVRRAYSLAAWAARPAAYELAIKREPRGAMSRWLWQHLRPGDRLRVSRPRGAFTPVPGAGPLVLLAGGIGITPLRAMAQQALAKGRPVFLFQAARSAAGLLYHGEFEARARQSAAFAYRAWVSRPAADWAGERGRLDAAQVLAALPDPGAADFYLCAGTAFMDAMADGLTAAGIAPRRIHRESFGAAAGAGPSGTAVAVRGADRAVLLHTAGEPTLLATLEAGGVGVEADCRAGTCGRCLVRLDAGDVTWHAQAEFPLSPGQILPCLCSPAGDVAVALQTA